MAVFVKTLKHRDLDGFKVVGAMVKKYYYAVYGAKVGHLRCKTCPIFVRKACFQTQKTGHLQKRVDSIAQ